MPRATRANPSKHRRAWRSSASALALSLATLLGSGTRDLCDAPTIIVISDSDKHLQEAAEGVRNALDARSTIVPLDQFRADCTLTAGHRYVGVGPAAASYLAVSAPSDVSVSFCMLPSADRAGIADRRGLVGVTTSVAAADQLDLIRRTLPAARRIGVLHRAGSQASREALGDLRAAASGLTIVAVDLDAESSVAAGIEKLTNANPDVIWTFADPGVYDAASVRSLLIASIRTKTPVFGFSAGVVRAGALFGINIDPHAQGAQLAELLNAEPGAGGIESAELRPVVNLIVAEQLGVEIPAAVKSQAVEIFR
ncbi:MAG: ABC transporter substrate binding protein [Phycisphaerales bacterium]